MEENEKRFEQDIESYLLSEDGGYVKGNPQDFNRECALNRKDLFTFIQDSQKNEWESGLSILFCTIFIRTLFYIQLVLNNLENYVF